MSLTLKILRVTQNLELRKKYQNLVFFEFQQPLSNDQACYVRLAKFKRFDGFIHKTYMQPLLQGKAQITLQCTTMMVYQALLPRERQEVVNGSGNKL